MPGTIRSYLRFAYASFFKPHTSDGKGDQQDALESFYKCQADAYDTTRSALLRGREDMLRLVAALARRIAAMTASVPVLLKATLSIPVNSEKYCITFMLYIMHRTAKVHPLTFLNLRTQYYYRKIMSIKLQQIPPYILP